MPNGPKTKKIYLYSLLTLGLYFFYWCSRSRQAINQSAKQNLIPSTWLLAIPAAHYWWMWQYARALEFVSYKRIKTSDTFLLYFIAVCLPYIVFSNASNFLPSNDLNQPVNWHAFWITVAAIVAALIIVETIGLAFFCATIQRKINKLTIPPSSPAARP